MDSLCLFDALKTPVKQAEFLDILPVSVIDVGAQGKRKGEDHGSTSSRANYSPFPVEVATLCAQFYLRDSTVVFDPFAGWGERGRAVLDAGKGYVGYDSSPKAIEKALADYGIQNKLANSTVVHPPEFYDGVLTCPPYWNLEKYDFDRGLDRAKDWQAFLRNLHQVFEMAYQGGASGTTFCIMVGDWRKNHIYYDLDFEVCQMFKDWGADVVDKVVVSRSKVSKIKIMLPQAKRLGYSVRVHENLLVFRKPS